jgi:hypothetical protein
MPKQTPSSKYDEFSKSTPSLSYFVYAKTQKLNQTETDIGYKAMLKLLKEKGGNRLLRRIAAAKEEKFRVRIVIKR